MQKPANLIYGIDEKPPLFTNIALGFQHTILLLIGSIFPVMIIRSLGIPVSLRTASSFVSISMMTSGIITLLQALKKMALAQDTSALPSAAPHTSAHPCRLHPWADCL